jgi:formiminotetrahydrofolate cyclodeaminase
MRDLAADLEACKKATPGPWIMGGFSGVLVSKIGFERVPKSSDDYGFIAAARTGWPEACERAIAAEARVAELEAENAKLRGLLSKVTKLGNKNIVTDNKLFIDILRALERPDRSQP